VFLNRRHAGEALAQALEKSRRSSPIVYALPRGGVPVAAVVADRLEAPLDLILVRKLGAPGHSELAIGAVVDGPAPAIILHKDTVRQLRIGNDDIARVKTAALAEIERRRASYLGVRPPIYPAGRTVIIVDDGLATGATMEAAVEAMRRASAKEIIVAVPVAPIEAAARFRLLADEFVCIETPRRFLSVGAHYENFEQLTDGDVIRALASRKLVRSSSVTAE
jgi:putative phosphoribosyl transferase